MTFPRSHNAPRRLVGGALATLLFFVALGLVQYLAPNLFGGIAARAALPLLSLRAAFHDMWRGRDAGQSEEARLRAENEFLRALIQAGVGVGQEDTEQASIVAPVLARPRWSAYDTLLIGAGEREGIAAGARVRAHGFFIGEIAEVYADSSLAILYSTPGREVTAQLGRDLPSVLAGTGGGAFEARVAEGASVRAGDGAFAPALSPRLFAVVDAVAEGGEGVWKVYLRLPVNIFELRAVEIEAS